tara:strand:- start:1474 stop:2292 length:819 start_codon:yes stop_codon:yes gene_type:complete
MPELPEVQTTVNCLKILINNEITKIKLYSTKLRYYIPKNISKLTKNSQINNIYRIAKYIIIELENNYCIIIHLGMSGRLILKNNSYKHHKHDHVIFIIKKKILIFNDPRKFGFIDLCKTQNLQNLKYFINLGIDPFSKKLNQKYLFEKTKNSLVPIKQILLNQKIISGIGNIYASEILFDAKLSPFIKGNQLREIEIITLIKSIRKILRKAINSGGTSIRDYISADGTLGNFQKKFRVYNKEDKLILGFKIKRVVQYSRSTFYCPEIQKLDR